MYDRDVVMMLSAVTDPIGVEQRKKHKLKRRVYQNKVYIFSGLFTSDYSCTLWLKYAFIYG